MKKIILLSIALITVGFLAAVAQNNIPLPEKYQGENDRFEYPDFETSKLPAIKKTKSGQDWWEPDTLYAVSVFTDSRLDERIINKYNSRGILEKRIRQWWINNSWEEISYSSYTYTYDSNNNVLTCLGPNLTTYTYDSNNNMLTKLTQIRENDLWVNYMLYTYTYDSNNNVFTELRQLWKNNSWGNNLLSTYSYDSNNNMLTRLSQDWINHSWGNEYSHTYTYDSNNNILTELRQNRYNNSWKNLWLYTYTYDSGNNRLTEKLLQNWINDSWGNYRLYTYTYDSGNNRLTEELLRQDWQNNSWVNYLRYRTIYDENRNGTSVEFWWWIGENWQSIGDMIIEIYYNNMQSNFQWRCSKITASYIKVSDITAINKPAVTQGLNDVSVYPNPTTGKLRITDYGLRITGVRIFNISGINVFNTQQTASDISHLPAGIYFVQIKTEKGIVTKKLAKL
jgi:hypothetical protein